MLVTSNDIEKVDAEEVGISKENGQDIISSIDPGTDDGHFADYNTADSNIGSISEMRESNEGNEDSGSPIGNFNPASFLPNMFGGGLPGLGGLRVQQTDENGNPIGDSPETPDYAQLFETYGKLFEQQDKNIEYLNGVINNLVSQLNKYKRNQSWKLRIMFILMVVSWIVMFIKL